MKFGELTGDPKVFEGLGHGRTRGKRECRIGIEGYTKLKHMYHDDLDPDTVIRSVIRSHELESGNNLMLLSLNAQETMCLVKDVALGQCYMKEEKLWIQLYKVAHSSLRAIVVFAPEWGYDKTQVFIESGRGNIESQTFIESPDPQSPAAEVIDERPEEKTETKATALDDSAEASLHPLQLMHKAAHQPVASPARHPSP